MQQRNTGSQSSGIVVHLWRYVSFAFCLSFHSFSRLHPTTTTYCVLVCTRVPAAGSHLPVKQEIPSGKNQRDTTMVMTCHNGLVSKQESKQSKAKQAAVERGASCLANIQRRSGAVDPVSEPRLAFVNNCHSTKWSVGSLSKYVASMTSSKYPSQDQLTKTHDQGVWNHPCHDSMTRTTGCTFTMMVPFFFSCVKTKSTPMPPH